MNTSLFSQIISSYAYCNSTYCYATTTYLSSLGDVFTKTPTKSSLKSTSQSRVSFSQRHRAVPPLASFSCMLLELFFFQSKKAQKKQLFFLIFFPPDSGQFCGDLLGEFVVFYISHTLEKRYAKSVVFFQKNNSISPPRFVLF